MEEDGFGAPHDTGGVEKGWPERENGEVAPWPALGRKEEVVVEVFRLVEEGVSWLL